MTTTKDEAVEPEIDAWVDWYVPASHVSEAMSEIREELDELEARALLLGVNVVPGPEERAVRRHLRAIVRASQAVRERCVSMVAAVIEGPTERQIAAKRRERLSAKRQASRPAPQPEGGAS
ncbi:MAG TPA: hypothetical protein VMI75_26735 [Polyangiaceae bacterium]|nr:hypothetical protein [Polyangiaceae bacterium]